MSGDNEMISLDKAARSVNWAMQRLGEIRKERDRYRDWFERLNTATAEYINTTQAALSRSRFADANEANKARAAERRARARAYRAAGMSLAVIGRKMGREDNRQGTGVAYSERTVSRWLSRKNPDQST